jgi:ABC-type multidrug transport system fused ATPase/permease subunit
VVTTSSPLLLDAVDEVAFVVDGQVVALGSHGELLSNHPAYRLIITRESEDDDPTDTRRTPVGSRA